MFKKKKLFVILLLIILSLFIPLIFRENAYITVVMCLIGIYIIACSGLDILFGYSGQISLGHAAFYAVGAYTSAILSTRCGVNVWICLIIAGVVSAAYATLLAIPTSKLVYMFLSLATIGFGELTYQAIINLPELTGSFQGVKLIPKLSIGSFVFRNSFYYYYIILVFVILFLFVKQRVIISKIGRAFIAIRENSNAANAMGVNVRYYKVLAFAISAFFTGIAGALYAHFIGFISPESFMMDQSVLFLSIVLIGGMGTFIGPIIGSLIMIFLNEGIQILGSYQMLVYGLFIITVILFMPDGLAGVYQKISKHFSKALKNVTVKKGGEKSCC